MSNLYFAKCAVVTGRTSSGRIIHGGFEPLSSSDLDEHVTGLKKIYPQLDSETKLIVIGTCLQFYL